MFRDSEHPPSPAGCGAYCDLQMEGLAVLCSVGEDQRCSLLLVCPQLSRTQMDAASEPGLKLVRLWQCYV